MECITIKQVEIYNGNANRQYLIKKRTEFLRLSTLFVISKSISDYLLFFFEARNAINADDTSTAKNTPELLPVLGEDVAF